MKNFNEVWSATEGIELIQVRPSEMQLIYKHCFEFNIPTIVEVGSAHGASSTILAQAAMQLNGFLECIDTYPEDYYNQDKFGQYAKEAFLINMQPFEGYYKLHTKDSGAFKETKAFGFSIDVLFIDGMHSYEGVKEDCKNLLPFLRSGGYVAFHDYNNVQFSGVKKAADEFTAGWETESEWDLIVRRKP